MIYIDDLKSNTNTKKEQTGADDQDSSLHTDLQDDSPTEKGAPLDEKPKSGIFKRLKSIFGRKQSAISKHRKNQELAKKA